MPHLQHNLAYQTKEILNHKFVSKPKKFSTKNLFPPKRKYFLYLTQNKHNFVLMQKNSFAPSFLSKEKFLMLTRKEQFFTLKEKISYNFLKRKPTLV